MSDELQLRTEEEVARTVERESQTAGGSLPAPEVRTVDSAYPVRPQASKKGVLREYFESAVVTLIMALFGMTFIVQAVKVPTGSMKNTIWIQDHLLVNKFIFGPHARLDLPVLPSRNINRGDVVVFKFPEDPQTNFVKRVIALPGETVEYRANHVYINGEQLPEHRVFVEPDDNSPRELQTVEDEPASAGAKWPAYYFEGDRELVSSRFNDEAGEYAVRQPFKVPVKGDPIPDRIKSDPRLRRIYDADEDDRYDSDQYFCMGDNRDNSQDSRYWGTVPRSSIVGRAMFVYWSIDRTDKADGNANPVFDFFTKSRWSRTGTFIK
ncbi:MAG TPA: signal peptidase I [Blastocatellia bacterium]|nr:signal peptidase I [Blastocatellia bacterium]